MTRNRIAFACLLILGLSGCAVSGSVGTASLSSQGDEIRVRSEEWGGVVECGSGRPGEPPCAAEATRERFP
jgi:hypothetical protein